MNMQNSKQTGQQFKWNNLDCNILADTQIMCMRIYLSSLEDIILPHFTPALLKFLNYNSHNIVFELQ
jgi:hypothetical protein